MLHQRMLGRLTVDDVCLYVHACLSACDNSLYSHPPLFMLDARLRLNHVTTLHAFCFAGTDAHTTSV